MGIFEITVGLISSMFLVLVFLLPGLLPTWINGTFGSGRRSTVFNTITSLFIFSSMPYAILAIIYEWVDKEFPLPIWGTNFQKFTTESQDLTQTLGSNSIFLAIEDFNLYESLNAIVWSMLISLVLLWFGLIIYRYRFIAKGLNWARLTEHFGEKDVWTNQLTHGTEGQKFVRLTDSIRKLHFTGWIEEFSEYDDFRELSLSDVEVYNFDNVLVSKSETTYLSLPKDNIWMDILSQERRIPNGNS